MVELAARLLVAGAALFVAGMFGILDFDFTWKVCLAIAAIGIFGQRLEAKGMKTPGIAGFIATADAFAIALLVASMHRLDTLGFLVLAPCAFAAARHGATPNFMAPLAASSLLVSFSVFQNGDIPGPMLLAQAGGILATGLMFSNSRTIVTVEKTVEVEREGAQGNVLELRENFRKLRDAYRDLERKSGHDRLVAQLDEARSGTRDKLANRLCAKLKEMCGADSVALYTVAQFADQLVVRAMTADYPKELEDASLPIDMNLAPGQIRHRAEKALLALQGDERRRISNVLLIDRGRLVGMICVGHQDPAKLSDARDRAEEIAPHVSSIVVEDQKLEAQERRLRETEVLYEIASLSAGSTNPTSLAARVTRDLWESLQVDHLSVFLIEENEPICLSSEGARIRLLESMTFSGGSGLNGWLRTDSPEVFMFDARDDHRITAEETLKKRVGSFFAIPLLGLKGPIGYLTAASHSRGGIDTPTVETLRIVASELAQSMTRLTSDGATPDGAMTPKEFSTRIKDQSGCLVYLEPLKKEQLVETFGKPALAHAIRKFVTRLRAKLPAGACLCRRDEGDYVVFLPVTEERIAASWANDVAATASMIAVKTPDGSAKIPLAVRAKVAILDRQESEVFSTLTA